MQRFYTVCALSCLALCFLVPLANAQTESGEDETLNEPVKVEREVGVYRRINELPESVRRSKIFARGLEELRHYAGFDGIYDQKARLDAFEQTKNDILRDAAKSDKVAGSKIPVFATAWTNIGPTNTAGMTKSLAINPSNGNIIYAGAAAGGVWKSVDAGASWIPLTDLVIPDLAVASIAIDPSSTSTIYAGSGDPSVATDGFSGSGLYKSTDAGTSWNKVGTAKLAGTISKVLVHPTNGNIILAAQYNDIYNGTGVLLYGKGLYRSTDGGATFSKVFPAVAANAQGVVWDVEAAEVSAGKQCFYFVEGNNPGGLSNECGIYKSIDDGATWTKISNAGLPAGSTIGKAALAIPAGEKTKVYCLMANPAGDINGSNLPGLWRSTDAGFTFSHVATVPSTLFNPQGNGPQGWYDLYLAIAPHTNPNDTLYIGGVEAYRSFNSGADWSAYSSYQINGLHVDNQSIAIDPTNSSYVYVGTDGGVYRSIDAGINWAYRSTGFETMRFYHIGLDNTNYLRTYGGAQDQGVWKITNGQGAAQFFGGDGFQPIVDHTNAGTVYVEGPFGDLYKTTNGGGSFFSIDDPAFTPGSPSNEGADWETPFVMAPNNSSVLYTGRQRVWRTANGGTNWSPVSPFFTYNSQNYLVESIGISPSNPTNVWWAGLEGGKIWLTTNAGSTWTDKSAGLPGETVRSIVCSPTNQSWALAAFESHSTAAARIMLTTNAGSTWTNVSGNAGSNLPGVPVNCIAIDSISPATVWYAATDNGIYYTRSGGGTGGTSWSIAGSGLGLAPCWDVQIHPNKTTIRVGTHGRSIWEGNVNILPVELTGLTAEKTATGTNLLWKTESEHDDSGFWVERSYNYQPFEDIIFIPGAGNSNKERNYNYFDSKHDPGYYIYRLNEIDLDGSSHLSNIVEVHFGTSDSSVRLDQNFPNPFFAGDGAPGKTTIQFELPNDDIVSLKISSLRSATVRTLLSNQPMQGGLPQTIDWDGTDDHNTPVAAGVYFYTLETASFGKLTNKLILTGTAAK